MKTHNNAQTYEHSLNHALEFFSKAGSLFTKKQSYYGSEETALKLFKEVWITDKELALQLALWLRHCRGGAGNRSGFRAIINWVATVNPEWIIANLEQIPHLGRWDDLKALYDTAAERAALNLWWKAINDNDQIVSGLAAKWAGRKDKKLRKFSELPPKKYRKILVKKTEVVESLMASKKWNKINYEQVPSIAMARYTNAFMRNDPSRFTKYKDQLEAGKKTINAGVLFPHDVIRTAHNGSLDIAAAQFKSLPNFIPKDERIMCIADSSGSMGIRIGGSVQAIDVSVGLSLYCSDRLSKDNPFYRQFLQFESETKMTNWSRSTIREVLETPARFFHGAAGSTNIYKALDTLLSYGLTYGIPNDQMPTVLMIISDMQFDHGVEAIPGTPVEEVLSKWENAGYTSPKIIYWNTAGYAGSPSEATAQNTALVSGFSPSILKAIFRAKTFTPVEIMTEALKPYMVNVPRPEDSENLLPPLEVRGQTNSKLGQKNITAENFNKFAAK